MRDQNNKPNFDFIMNQPGSELEAPRRSKKPLVFIVAAVVFLGVLTTIGLVLTKRSTNVQQVSSTGQSESEQYLSLLADGKTEEVYNMYEQSNRPDRQIYDIFATTYPKSIDMKGCLLRPESTQINADTSIFVYRCNYFNKPSTSYIDFAFIFQQINGKKQLTRVQPSEIKP